MVDWSWASIAALVGVPVLRSVGGWLGNALQDGKLELIEFRQLGETVIRVGLIGVATYIGLGDLFGIDISALGAAFSAFLMDMLWVRPITKLIAAKKI